MAVCCSPSQLERKQEAVDTPAPSPPFCRAGGRVQAGQAVGSLEGLVSLSWCFSQE